MYADGARFCTRDGARLVAATPVRSTVAHARNDGSAPPSHYDLVGRTLEGRYQIHRKVGEGGMSFVYLATDVATRERYAIKVLSAALSSDENAMARLRREASVGMRLAHPNICHIIRLGETEDSLVYVVMPFVEGEILSDRTNRLGVIPPIEAARLVADMASGLQVAHDLKIVHRDLKPENVMVCPRPGGGDYAVVMDFGLAKEGGRRASEADGNWHHPGHAGVHEPRTAPWQAPRREDGHLFSCVDGVRDAHRETSLPGTHATGDDDRETAKRPHAPP